METTVKNNDEKIYFDRFILGEDERCHISTDSEETGLNNNILVVGGSGSGKSTSVVMPMLMHLEHSNAVGVFTKRSIMDKMKRVLNRHGYTVSVIDFANPKESEYGFDPLSYCKSENDVRDLAHEIVYSGADSKKIFDPYWYDSAENLIDLVLRYVWNGHYSKGRSMSAALELLDGIVWTDKSAEEDEDNEDNEDDEDNSLFDALVDDSEEMLNRLHDGDIDEKELEKMTAAISKQAEKDKAERKRKRNEEFAKLFPTHNEFRRLKEIDPDGGIVWQSFIDLSDVTGACVAASVQAAMFSVFGADIREILSTAKMYDFKNLTKPKEALFLYVSPVSIAQHRYVSLFYTQVFKNLFELAEKQKDYALPYPVQVICDDFATGCRIKGFEELISIFREKRIATTLLLQSESQLESLYNEHSATTIINNCDTYIYLGGMDLKTAKNIGKRLNAPLSDILSMPVGTEYFFRRGKKPIVTKRYNPFKDEVYTEVFGENNLGKEN